MIPAISLPEIPPWLALIWADTNGRIGLLLLGGTLLAAIVFGGSGKSQQYARQTQKPESPKLPRHWRWPWQRKSIPWKLGSVTVDLRGGSHTIHAVVAGMSGTGKSTAVLPLLMGKMPALVVAFDNSRPIRDLFLAKGWTIWQPGGTLGWDILSGSAQVVSEALVAGMPESNQSVGIMSGMAQERIWEALDALDAAKKPRTIGALTDALSVRTGNPIQDRACLDWAVRFRRVAKSLGSSLGTDLDLGEAMRRGDKILILPNRFLSPKDAPLIGAIALVQARRVAQEVGDFLLIVEEAGQAGSRQVEMNALAQAGRDRGCPLIVLTQNMAKLPEEVVNNVKVWISFAQESSRELAFAAERLRLPSTELLFEHMHKPGTAWVRSPDHNSTRVQLSLPKLPKPPSYVSEPTPSQTATPARRRIIVREVGTAVVRLSALPSPPLEVQALLSQIDRSQGDCWLWTGKKDDDGYGLQRWSYADEPEKPKNNRPAHQVVWEVINDCPFPRDEKGKRMDWRHRRTCPRHCVNPYHGEPGTRRQNVQERWADARVGGAGG